MVAYSSETQQRCTARHIQYRPRASDRSRRTWRSAPPLSADRYLLCSDGLSAVVDRGALHAALSVPAEPEQVAGQLIDLAYAHGAPDNIACVVADAVTA